VAEICQNRIADKGRFFRGPSAAQIEKCKTNESLDITWDICSRSFRSKRYSKNVLKLFVSSLPFKIEGVLYIYVLLFHEGQAENHFDMFFHMK
jgi:hypothetical protein